ncbi:MAG TPA: non-canonical purine NTP pyrophosphatase, partial [bacterium]|nr:non-canonical purine NTP pyrophosphatase [bacterium]
MNFKFCLATKNPAKVKEIYDILKNYRCEIIVPSIEKFPEETGSTFAENALTKALFVAKKYPS